MNFSLKELHNITDKGKSEGEWPFWAATVSPSGDVKCGSICGPDIAVVGLNPSSGLHCKTVYDFLTDEGIFNYPAFDEERRKEKSPSRTRKRILKTLKGVASEIGKELSIVNTNVVWRPSAKVKSIADLLKLVMKDPRPMQLLEYIQPRLILAHGEASILYCGENLPIPTFYAETLKRSHFAFVSNADLGRMKPKIVAILQ
jgi:hypothetical protein